MLPQKCNGCSVCEKVCNVKAIKMKTTEKGFLYPIIDKEKCVECRMCENRCPILNEIKKRECYTKTYVAYNINEEERIKSSSGGIFILLAKKVIQKNGVVFGAYLDEKQKVKHGYAEKEEELAKFMGSKYVQSEIGDTYREVQSFLKEGRYVLFSGTPCQNAGLKSFLGKEYNKLYMQDIICHGVPSPLVWEKYKEYREKIDNDIPEKISFRNKDEGWKLFNMKFEYKNQNTYKQNQNKDLFMRAFLKNTILRDSCYDCAFKTEDRLSDITLGDYWGIENVHPELDDNKGSSVVIINSEKGQLLFDEIKEELFYKESDYEMIKKCNPALISSVKKDPNREKFFENIDKLPFNELVEKYTYKPSVFRKGVNKLKHELLKVCKKLKM